MDGKFTWKEWIVALLVFFESKQNQVTESILKIREYFIASALNSFSMELLKNLFERISLWNIFWKQFQVTAVLARLKQNKADFQCWNWYLEFAFSWANLLKLRKNRKLYRILINRHTYILVPSKKHMWLTQIV